MPRLDDFVPFEDDEEWDPEDDDLDLGLIEEEEDWDEEDHDALDDRFNPSDDEWPYD